MGQFSSMVFQKRNVFGQQPMDDSNSENLVIYISTSTSKSSSILTIIRLCIISSDLLKANKQVDNFGQILDNFFRPLFEVTLDPQTHPQLHELLKHISGFDSVDDESKIETLIFDEHTANPAAWTSDHNPPYSYYIYYFYANLQVLNQLRKLKSLNTFSNRPHCGESGSIFHLVIGYLLAENISHGIVIKNVLYIKPPCSPKTSLIMFRLCVTLLCSCLSRTFCSTCTICAELESQRRRRRTIICI